ncbi:hypothetical protein ES702_07422 [subsurface metagenome]
MRKKLFPLILIFTLISSPIIEAKNSPELPPKYKKWVDEEVVYIITSREEKVFRELETDKQRDLFIEEFWRQRDPTSGASRNEFKEEHYRRIEYANEWLGKGTPKPGWKTERGRIYIILGEPIYRQRFHSSHYIYPTELWFYQGNVSQGMPPFFYIVFFKRFGLGDFKLYSPQRDGPNSLLPVTSHEVSPLERSFEASQRRMMGKTDADAGGAAYGIISTRVSYDLAQASLSLIPGGVNVNPPSESEKLLGKVNTFPQKKVDDEYAYEFLKHKASVEVSYSVHYIGNTSLVKTIQDEFGLFFLHYSIQPQNLSVEGYKDKYYSNIKISGRVTDLEGMTIFQYDREYPMEFSKEQIKQVKLIPMAIQDSFPLVPGHYKFSILLQNTVSKEFTSFDRDIIIPEIKDSPQMSKLVLAFQKKEDRDSLKSSFKVGEMRLYPSLRKEFARKDTLYLFFQLYGLTEELKEEGWIKYTFFKGGKKQYVRKKRIRDYQDGRDFLEEFSLKEFPPSGYRIMVSVLDRDEREVLFEEDRFSVSSKIYARPWVQFKKYPGSEDPIYSFILGMQLLNKGEMEKAEEELKKAHKMQPEREDFAIAYARVLLGKVEYEEIKKVLNPFVEKPIENYNFYYIIGRAHQGLKEYEDAVSCYQKHISHEGASVNVLNSIGECYFKMGNHKEAIRAWEESLEINPNQPEIKKNIDIIKSIKEN